MTKLSTAEDIVGCCGLRPLFTHKLGLDLWEEVELLRIMCRGCSWTRIQVVRDEGARDLCLHGLVEDWNKDVRDTRTKRMLRCDTVS